MIYDVKFILPLSTTGREEQISIEKIRYRSALNV
jgi:hypothetical protein